MRDALMTFGVALLAFTGGYLLGDAPAPIKGENVTLVASTPEGAKMYRLTGPGAAIVPHYVTVFQGRAEVSR